MKAAMQKTRYDAVIAGGGHNGLVAGFYLAAAGLSTLVLERREVPGGLSSPMEFMPGYRGAITNSPGSLEPKVVMDMRLAEFGLRFQKSDPTVVVPLASGRVFVGWRDPARVQAQLEAISPRDARTYHEILAYFTDFASRMGVSTFEPPPSLAELAGRFRTPRDEDDFSRIFFGSIRDFLDERLETGDIKTILAQIAVMCGNVGPSTPGSPVGMLFRPLSLASTSIGADHDPRRQPLRGSTGLPVGGMGSVTLAMAQAAAARGAEVLTGRAVARIVVADGRVRGVVTDRGEEITAGLVLSNLNPRTTLLNLLEAGAIDDDLATRLRTTRMQGSAFKVVLALDGVPRFRDVPEELVVPYASCQWRISPSVEYLDVAYDDYRSGRPSRGPRLLGLVPTLTDPTLAPPGKHMFSVNVWFAPYHLREGHWDTEKHVYARHCIDCLAEYAPNLKDIITDYRCFSPLDLEREFGLVEGHHLHGDMTPRQMFGLRPTAGMSDYRTPVRGLYLCGSGTWPGGFVTGIPGHNAAQQALRDLREGRVGPH